MQHSAFSVSFQEYANFILSQFRWQVFDYWSFKSANLIFISKHLTTLEKKRMIFITETAVDKSLTGETWSDVTHENTTL